MRRVLVNLLCLAVLVAGLAGWARSAATFPVIVVFDGGAPFAQFQEQYRADERSQANPAAWGYLDRGVIGMVQAFERQMGFRAGHVYSAALQGFSARLTAEQIQVFEHNPWVDYVEADGVVTTTASPSAFLGALWWQGQGRGKPGGGGGSPPPQVLPWGIDRIDADSSSTLAGDGAGAVGGVHIYIIDTGVEADHSDLNVIQHVNFASGPNKDCNGHGTHVSGTVAASDNATHVVGAAPGAPITGVRVLGCGGSGTVSGVVAGIDWVTANRVLPAVANMSLGGGASNALDDAVRNSVASGVFYSIAAGNSSANACDSSPARAGAGSNNGIMTVAATDSSDEEAGFSNFGSCVDIWAPGVGILSTSVKDGLDTLSGTSMAAPHVGGTGALYLSTFTGASPASVEAALKSNAVTTGTNSKDGASVQLVHVGNF